MFYRVELKDHIRVPPMYFDGDVKEAVRKSVKQKFEGYIDQDIGVVVDVSSVKEIGQGIVIPGDGAAYYDTVFELITFKPELQEVIAGSIKDITDFGAFLTMGPIDGMIHISQTMDDFVSFGKEKVLLGRDSKRTLKVNDGCKARIIAVSFKDVANPKIGLTMRQPGMGKPEWVSADATKAAGAAEEAPKKDAKKEKKGKKE